MINTLLLIIFGMATVYFGVKSLQIMPTFFKLLAALLSGQVKWPGPRVHDLDHSASVGRESLGVGYQNLFPTFIFNALVALASFCFSLLHFLGNTSLMSDSVWFNWTWGAVILTLIAYAGGRMGVNKAQRNAVQMNAIFSDLANTVEPRAVDGQTAEAEYAIEHPLIGHQSLSPKTVRALNLYREALAHRHAGDQTRGEILYQQAMNTDPSLHKRAYKALSDMSQGCSPADSGAIYYWLGIHSECLGNLHQASTWYEKATQVFGQLRYQKRQGRAHCNLGTVHLKRGEHNLGMDEFEKAVALNPSDGIAHFNIGMMYYRISNPGEQKHLQALDSFAEAIAADPQAYGTVVATRMRSHSYTWKEDLEEVLGRVARLQH